MPDKFLGYAQQPYQLHKELPHYLKKPNETPKYPRRKAQSLIMNKQVQNNAKLDK